MEAGWRVGSEERDQHNFEELRAEQEAVEVKACEEGICCVHNQFVKDGPGEKQVARSRRS